MIQTANKCAILGEEQRRGVLENFCARSIREDACSSREKFMASLSPRNPNLTEMRSRSEPGRSYARRVYKRDGGSRQQACPSAVALR